jgi:hypothetical protein
MKYKAYIVSIKESDVKADGIILSTNRNKAKMRFLLSAKDAGLNIKYIGILIKRKRELDFLQKTCMPKDRPFSIEYIKHFPCTCSICIEWIKNENLYR